jgi:uncharacterized protein with PQ loop repeat
MSFESFTGVLASLMGVAMAMAPLLQARRVRQLHDSSEVSVAFFLILITGSMVWLMRGVVTRDPVLVIPNLVALIVEVVTLLVVLRYRQGALPALATPTCAPSAAGAHAAGVAWRRRMPRVTIRR